MAQHCDGGWPGWPARASSSTGTATTSRATTHLSGYGGDDGDGATGLLQRTRAPLVRGSARASQSCVARSCVSKPDDLEAARRLPAAGGDSHDNVMTLFFIHDSHNYIGQL
jgi:hypothetical protein